MDCDDTNKTMVDAEARDQLLEPFIAAVSSTLGEMANAEITVRSVCQAVPTNLKDLSAVLEITSNAGGFLLLNFPEHTAAALASRILAQVTTNLDASLIGDCMGEIANVVAGQAKAMLAGGPHQFTFSIPRVLDTASSFRPPPGLNCLTIVFDSDQGPFNMQLFLTGSGTDQPHEA